MDFELWTIDSSKSSNLQTTAGGPNDEQAELQLKELEAEDLWPVLNEEDKKEKNKWGTTKNLRSRPKHGSREETAQSSKWLRKVEVVKKNKKIKNVRNGSLVYKSYQVSKEWSRME